MKRYLFLLLFLLTAVATRATAVGEWTHYLSYQYASSSVATDTHIYALYDGNLLAYDMATTEVKLYSKTDGLTGKYISRIAYDYGNKCLVLAYADANIDLLCEDGDIVPIPQLKNANDGSMEIIDLTICDGMAVVTTGQGVGCIDVSARSFFAYYDLRQSIDTATAFDGSIFASTPEGILSCRLDNNPLDMKNWTKIQQFQPRNMFVLNGELIAFVPYLAFDSGRSAGVWHIGKEDGQGSRKCVQIDRHVYWKAFPGRDKAFFVHPNHVGVVDKSNLTALSDFFSVTRQYNYISYAPDGTYRVADGYNGLCTYSLTDGEFRPTGETIGGYGPRRDYCYSMTRAGKRLLVAGGRVADVFYDGVAYIYEDGKWKHLQDDGISDVTGVRYVNAMSILQDPDDPQHHYVASGGTGLYEFRDLKFERQYTWKNSPLVPANGAADNPLYVRTAGLSMDAQKNLWIINNERDTILYALKPDGRWKGIYVAAIRNAPTCECTMIDSKGRLWMGSRRTVDNHTAGLLCLDYNGTVDNTADDVSVYRTHAPNQDGTDCKLSGVYALAEASDGSIWIGAGNGLFVIDDPNRWGESNFNLTQIKVPRNDGTNYADYLLADVPVSAIAIDGGGRKWLGTADNGLFVVSPDGTSILHHFDTSNSGILSDGIYAISPDPETGEVMIGTTEGLCSYMSEATQPAETLDKDNILVYPNPVRPEYHGSITVRGLTADADVKIVTTGGQAVASGTSTGGTFVWDGRTQSGERVASGVYYIMVSTTAGDKGVAAKVVVI